MGLKTLQNQRAPKRSDQDTDYSAIDKLNGKHPWAEIVPEGRILYPARKLKKGEVAYFNYQLAKEMGLISKDHPNKMNRKLEQKLIETFSIRIVNEYDQEKKLRIPNEQKTENTFMATRYLQLQHENKQGKTSGDGRCIWNGIVKKNGKTWDVSSRGTGVTALAPGSVISDKPLKSGNTDFGYGCGLAEIDELYSSAIMSEIFHNNDTNTERMLTIIDIGSGLGIGVRAAPNLIRPAHMFLFLKQNNYDALKRATDFFIDRQIKNKEWSFNTKTKKKYYHMLDELCNTFAKFTAKMDREYIFAWLDWDGDNVLANAGIIDYGSVRQFGLRHDQYRYDDDERWSTNLNEQRTKAKLMIQVFIQMTDYLFTKKKKSVNHFSSHPILKKFDQRFDEYLLEFFMQQVGFEPMQSENLLKENKLVLKKLFKSFSSLERMKTSKKLSKIADGVNRPAIYNMRKVLAILPEYYLNNKDKKWMPAEDMLEAMGTENCTRADLNITPGLKRKILNFQKYYRTVLKKVVGNKSFESTLIKISKNAQSQNQESRVTGNALLFIVDEIMKQRKRGLSNHEIQNVIDHFVTTQSISHDNVDKPENFTRKKQSKKLVSTMLRLVDGYKEDI